MIGALSIAALAVLLWPDGRGRGAQRLRAMGHRADIRRTSGERPVPATAAVLSAAVAAVLSTPLVAGLAAGVAFLGARSWVARRSERRVERRLESLTEGLGALAADLRSGRALDAATEAALAACADAESAAALACALRAPAAAPAPGPDQELTAALQRIAAGVLLSTRTGCSLAAVTAAVEDDLRARHRLRLHLRTATAGPRASAMVLAGLPLLGLAMGSGVGADPWKVLTTTASGQVLMVVGTALELAGLSWSGHLVRRALR
ncbi:type II secretion system F family protein [Blastococcus mobilis]|uniref:Tight adherence protein B n=1 Tax=Blastococcus mobilis TaxID=1938746 RepID=A0A238VWK0_9ACTN|nr:pilus assembly protein TadB [Blastococcus mobilis]SNR38504.1 tight adherence protein B [Blastococcus mobilis]